MIFRSTWALTGETWYLRGSILGKLGAFGVQFWTLWGSSGDENRLPGYPKDHSGEVQGPSDGKEAHFAFERVLGGRPWDALDLQK